MSEMIVNKKDLLRQLPLLTRVRPEVFDGEIVAVAAAPAEPGERFVLVPPSMLEKILEALPSNFSTKVPE